MSIITKNIIIDPRYLTPMIDEYLFQELKKKYEKTCCPDHGFIISIDDIISTDNLINKDSIMITFSITFKAKTIKPQKDMILSFIPTLIISKGVFGKIYENIPDHHLLENHFIFDEQSLSFKSENQIINNSTEVTVKIDQFICDTQKYNCIVILN
jgi:DNA-directed RNA polymerase subunit E'/Rpb7